MVLQNFSAHISQTVPKACKAFENEMGATLPFKYFDPLGMAKDRPSFDGFTVHGELRATHENCDS